MKTRKAPEKRSNGIWWCVLAGTVLVIAAGDLFLGGSSDGEGFEGARSDSGSGRSVAAASAPRPAAPDHVSTRAPAPAERRDERHAPNIEDFTRLRDASLGDATRAEKAGRFQEALDALAEAEANGAKAADLAPARARLKAELAESGRLDEVFASADHALSTADFDRGLYELQGVAQVAKEVGRQGELERRVSELGSARARAERLSRGQAAIERAAGCLDANDLAGAREQVDKARELVPGNDDLARVEARLRALEHLPKGMLYVEVAPGRGLYVHKHAVSNAEFKLWIDETGRTGAAPWKTPFAPELGDAPVRDVFLDAAKNYAASRDERLPTDDEWPAIRKALHLTSEEGRPHAGVLVNGFYTVQPLS